MTFTLDPDEREFIECLVENAIIKEKIIKYARLRGINLRGEPFTYDKQTGKVEYGVTPDR